MKLRNFWLAGVLAVFAAQASAQGSGVAFVTDVKGEATLDAGKARLMAEVKKGARIGCSGDCAVGVMYMVSGKEYVLKGPGDFIVGDNEVTAKIGAPPSMRETTWKVSTKVVSQAAQTSSASVRMRSLAPAAAASAPLSPERLVYPKDTCVVSLQPAFRWASESPKGPFEFELKTTKDAKSIYKGKATATALSLPSSVKLQADVEYAWVVKAAGKEVGAATFKTLPTHSLELSQKRKPEDKAGFSDWLLYALTLKDLGADQDAGDVWARLAKERPDLPELAMLAK